MTLIFCVTLSIGAQAKVFRFGEMLCNQKDYRCEEIEKGDTWDKHWPGAEQRDLIKRINRMNVRLRPGMKIAVPVNLEGQDKMKFAPLPMKVEALGEKQILVNLNLLAWGAYDEQGNLVNWGPAAGGKSWCPDEGIPCRTRTGTFRVLSLGGAKCKSSKFPIPRGGAPMPYCMYFHGGYALHGSYEVPGYNASHGCVRIFPEDAKWLNQEFVRSSAKTDLNGGAAVLIEPYEDPEPPAIPAASVRP